MSWKEHWKKILKAAFCMLGFIYLFVLLVDPYDTIEISLPLDREPIVSNQRYSYPAIAQKSHHDSAIIGTSTIRLLNPSQLNPLFQSSFVNLAMNSPTAYEQLKIFELFRRTHENIKYVIFGIDETWCDANANPDKFTFRPFPPWLYDNSEFNDYLYLLSGRGLENSVRMIEYWLGKRKAKFSGDGYDVFVGDDGRYDLNKAINNIYGNNEQKSILEEKVRNNDFQIDRNAKYKFPVQEMYLSKMGNSLSDETVKIFMFVPYHVKNYYSKINIFEACKKEIVDLASSYRNSYVIDFMFPSGITTEDSNYWDVLHYRIGIADMLPRLIDKAMAGEIENLPVKLHYH